jgi:DNA-binding IclR family transcriptional regulator
MRLAAEPAGLSVKHLSDELDIPNPELRQTQRKLDAAGLARRTKGTWLSVPLEASDPELRASKTATDIPSPT